MQERDLTVRGAVAGGERVVRRAGRFRLVQAAGGFVWTFTDKAGACWYWNTREWRWTGRPRPRPTAAEATAGFDPFAPPDPVRRLR
jgi:hypothetical protein